MSALICYHTNSVGSLGYMGSFTMKYMKILLVVTVFSLWFLPTGYCAIFHVPADFLTIQAGMDAAGTGDTVLVSDGVYMGTGNIDLDFRSKAITVTSSNGPENCIIDCQGAGRGFIFQGTEDENSIVSGLTITGGYVDCGG